MESEPETREDCKKAVDTTKLAKLEIINIQI
jgi:hypothetical protein